MTARVANARSLDPIDFKNGRRAADLVAYDDERVAVRAVLFLDEDQSLGSLIVGSRRGCRSGIRARDFRIRATTLATGASIRDSGFPVTRILITILRSRQRSIR